MKYSVVLKHLCSKLFQHLSKFLCNIHLQDAVTNLSASPILLHSFFQAEFSISVLGVRIKSNSKIAKELQIYDSNGALLHQEFFMEEEKHFNLNLKSGMYFVVIKSSEGIFAKKKVLIEGAD